MTYQQLIRHFGSQAEAARQLHIPQTTISAWRDGIPAWRQAQLTDKLYSREGRKVIQAAGVESLRGRNGRRA